jgi:hypothetical protein
VFDDGEPHDGSSGGEDEADGSLGQSRKVRARERRMAELAGSLNLLYAELVRLTREVLDDRSWEGDGLRSPAHYLSWKLGLSTARASEIVRMAQRRGELPHTMEAFDRGEITVDQVAVIAKRVPAYADEDMAVLAHSANVNQLRRTVRAFNPDDVPPPGCATEDQRPRIDDRCSFGTTDSGTFRLFAAGNADGGSVIESALRQAQDRLFHEGGGQRPIGWWEALVDVCDRSLDGSPATSTRDRFRIYLHLDGASGALSPTFGPAMERWIRDLILCDATVQPVWERDGVPVSVGRSRHTPPERTRRLVLHRDGGCRRPGCASTIGLNVHHIAPWHPDGRTDTDNLVSLCRRDHRLVHVGDLRIDGNADVPFGQPGSLEFRNRHGVLIRDVAPPTAPTGPPPVPDVPYEHPEGERLYQKWVTLPEPPDPDPPDASEDEVEDGPADDDPHEDDPPERDPPDSS